MKSEKTGYPSKDMPQLKYYRKNPLRDFEVNQKTYTLIKDVNQYNLGYHAIGYLGQNISYQKLLEDVETAAKAFNLLGVKDGDVVPILTTNTPEVAVMFLALNKIGAVSKWVDLRSGEQELIHHFNMHDCKICVCFDKVLKGLENILEHTNIKNVIVNKPVDSLPKVKQIGYDIITKIKEPNSVIPKDKKFITYEQFMNFAKECQKFSCNLRSTYDKDKPSLIVQSSGTTGMSKSIVHTDYSINNSFKEWSYTDFPFYPGNTLLVTVPPFVAYGLIGSYFLALSHGMKAELCPVIDAVTVYDNLGKFDISFGAPLHYRYLKDQIDTKKDQDKIKDLLKVKAFVTGGDKISEKELKEIEELLKSYGCYAPVLNGYGNNEGLGAECVNPYMHNKHGSIGVPLPFNKFVAVDLNTGEELKYGEVGEICVQTETKFQEYTNNPIATNEIKQVHSDGNEWLHSGDLGYIDEEGYIFLKGRLRRVIIKAAFKISPDTIEKVICSHSAVKDCVTVGVNDPKDLSVPMAFIVLKEEYLDNKNQILEEIKEICKKGLKDYEFPTYFEFIDAIPYTANNKQDFRKLENLGNELIENKNSFGKSPKVLKK